MAPQPGTSAFYECTGLVAWAASELHPAVGPFWGPIAGEILADRTANLKVKLAYLNDSLLAGGKKFLVGDAFSIADSYTCIILSWMVEPYPGQAKGLPAILDAYPVAKKYFEGIMALPNVKAAQARMAEKPSNVL